MAVYMLVLGLNPWVNLAIVVILSALVFVPIRYVYPSRTVRLQRLTLLLTFLWTGIGVVGLIQYPDVPAWVMWGSFAYIGYYLVISVFPGRPRPI